MNDGMKRGTTNISDNLLYSPTLTFCNMRNLVVAIALTLTIVGHSVEVDELAVEIIYKRIQAIPERGFVGLPSEKEGSAVPRAFAQRHFLSELLKEENRTLRKLFALHLAEEDSRKREQDLLTNEKEKLYFPALVSESDLEELRNWARGYQVTIQKRSADTIPSGVDSEGGSGMVSPPNGSARMDYAY